MEIVIKNFQVWCENHKLKDPRSSVNHNHEEYVKKFIQNASQQNCTEPIKARKSKKKWNFIERDKNKARTYFSSETVWVGKW